MKKKLKFAVCLSFIYFSLPLWAQTYQRTAQGVKMTTQELDIQVEFYSPSIVRVYKSPKGVSYEKKVSL